MVAFADAIDADVLRIRHEFLEMPGLVLTVPQAARLYGLSASHARAMLDTLVAEGFLVAGPNRAYRRSTLSTRD
jgi:Fic family protein